MNKKVEIYCVDGHPACDLAVGIFDAKGIEYTKVPNAMFCHRFLSDTIISAHCLS